jgi:hypothetical protein
VAIEAASFTNPWTRDIRGGVAQPRHSHIASGPDAGAALVGFCAFCLIFDEIHINNLVYPDRRGRGYGTAPCSTC